MNSIWEGSGNVQCLDVLRALQREPAALAALFAELATLRGHDRVLGARVQRVEDGLRDLAHAEARARLWVEELAMLLAASVLTRAAPAFVADAYVKTRLHGERGAEYGAFAGEVDVARLLERALP